MRVINFTAGTERNLRISDISELGTVRVNLVMDTVLDATNIDRKNNSKSLYLIKQYMFETLLIDVWRSLNEERFQYTYAKKKPFTASRIDYFLVNYCLTANIKAEIIPACFTDHNLIQIVVDLKGIPRGKGLWKMNNSHLKNIEYVKAMNNSLNDTVYNFSVQNGIEKWETIKENVIKTSMKWSQRNASKNKKDMRELIYKMKMFKTKIEKTSDQTLRQEYVNNLEKTKTIYEEKLSKRVQGSIVRARQHWYNEEASGSSYFLNLEKTRYSNKTMKMLIKEDGSIVRDSKKILLEQYKFYKKLYSADPKVYFSYTNNTDIKLSNEDKEKLDKPLYVEVMSKALANMQNNKTPGIDGISTDFYKVFWSKLKGYLFDAINLCIEKRELYVSARRGILALMPKRNKPPEFVTSYRPLTLMSTDHKIFAKLV